MTLPSKLGFVRTLLLPALLFFMLPVFSVWFAGYAERDYDADFRASVFPQIDADTSLGEEQRTTLKALYQRIPPSSACRDQTPGLAGYREMLGDLCDDYAQFGWARRVAVAAIVIGLFAVVIALCCSLWAFLSRPAQYLSFVVGWNVLKVVGALETLLQGGLLVWLSFWMTAIFSDRYVVKLILLAAVLAGAAAFAVIVAIFRRPAQGIDVEGEPLSERDAPTLWLRVRQICQDLGTAPPDHIVAGIDDNFFVTEGEVRVAARVLPGRVLYVSLSLLRALQRSEADAVLAHEMAHLLGGDTGHSKKLAPLTARFVQYLEALYKAGITRPIYYFMRAYFAVFQLAVGRSHRAAEFAADSVAAKLTSARDIGHALIKIGAYASFRGRVEEELFEQDRVHAEVGIAARVAHGFTSYVRTDKLHFDLHASVTPHPFDSHPPLSARLEQVGCALSPKDYEAVLVSPVGDSWVSAITPAADIEGRLWGVYEQRFAAAHDLALAYRYEPANESERAHVEKHFPVQEFAGKKAGELTQLDFEGVRHFDWEAPVAFEDVKSASIQSRMFKRYLDIKLKQGGMFKSKRSVCISKLAQGDAFVAEFNRYYGRHQTMVQQRNATGA